MKRQNPFSFCTTFLFSLFLLFSTIVVAQKSISATDILQKHKEDLWKNYQTYNNTATLEQNQVDALYYKLELQIQFNPNLLIGKVSNRYRSRVDSLSSLQIDLDDNLIISNITGPVLDYNHTGQKVHINLSQTFNENELIEISIEYSGIPDPGPNRWFVFDTLPTGENHVWTLSEPYGAKYWWPCKDTPADKADSVDIFVTVPQQQIVASNGSLISDSIDEDGKRTFHYKELYPIATYLVSLAIAPYAHFTDVYTTADDVEMLLDYYVYPEYEQLAIDFFPIVKEHLDALSFYFGPYPFINEKYGMAQFGSGGAMEHQTISSIGRVSADWNMVYVHELGHQWFGDALTCASWTDIWLNEGFASYSEALYAERTGYLDYPPGREAYKNYMSAKSFFENGTITIEDTSQVANIFNRIVYDKGAWLLHMLRKIIGDEDFFAALYLYVNGPLKYSSVTTADFIAVCENISGQSLTKFFDQWLNFEYYPIYSFYWEKNKEALNNIEITITQEQNNVIYEMPIDLQFEFAAGRDTTITVLNSQKVQVYSFSLTEVPLKLNFDPENWILKKTIDKSAGEFTTDVKIEAIYPNPVKTNCTIVVKYWGTPALSLKIFDVSGRLVREIKPFFQSALREYYFNWDRKNKDGRVVASGVYFLKAVGGLYNSEAAKKIIVIK